MTEEDNRYDYTESSDEQYEETISEIKRNYKTDEEKKDKLNDIVITQCILCLIIVTAVIILNIFYPDISRGLIEKYKEYSGSSDAETVSEIVQSVNNYIQ